MDHAIRATLHLDVDGLRRFARERRLSLEGTIVADTLAENGGAGRPLRGLVTWRLLDENRVPYTIEFEGDDGKPYSLRGQRDFFFHNAIGSLTTMHASLYDESGTEIGRAQLHFEPKMEIPALLRSFRPRLRLRSR